MSGISKVKLTDFESHEASDIDLAKVNIIIGENGAGKSTIVNGITMGISGTLPTKPYSDYVRTGAEQAGIELDVKIGENTRQTRKVIGTDGKVKTELLSTNNLLAQMGTNPETARTLADTWYFVESATETARRNVLSSVLSKEYTIAELQNAIAAKASDTHKAWHNQFIAGNFENLSDTKKTQLEMLYKIAYAERTAVKKDILRLEEQMNDTNSKLSAYAEIPQTVDPESVQRTIKHTELTKTLEFSAQNLETEKKNIEEYAAKIESLRTTKTQLEANVKATVEQEEVNRLQSNVNVLQSQLRGIREQISKLSNATGEITCPLYGIQCDFDPTEAKEKLEQDQTIKEQNLEATVDSLNEKQEQLSIITKIKEMEALLDGADTKNAQNAESVKQKQEQIAKLNEEIKELENLGVLTQEGLDASKNQTEVSNLKARKTVYEEDLKTRKASLSQLEEAVALYKDKEIWTSLLSCNKDIFISKLKEIVELLIPKYTVDIDDSMNLSFGNISINTLSKSEKFRVGVGIQTALSIAAKLGIVIIDGSDIVTDPTNLIETINKLGVLPEIETLIVTSSYDFTTKNDKRKTKIEVPATHYVVQDGKVERKPDLFGEASW